MKHFTREAVSSQLLRSRIRDVMAPAFLIDGIKAAYSDQAGRGFRTEAGHRTDVKPAGVPMGRRPGAVVLPRVGGEDHGGELCRQAVSAFLRLRRLSPDSSIR